MQPAGNMLVYVCTESRKIERQQRNFDWGSVLCRWGAPDNSGISCHCFSSASPTIIVRVALPRTFMNRTQLCRRGHVANCIETMNFQEHVLKASKGNDMCGSAEVKSGSFDGLTVWFDGLTLMESMSSMSHCRVA